MASRSDSDSDSEWPASNGFGRGAQRMLPENNFNESHGNWVAKVPLNEMLSLLRGDREQLPVLINDIDEQAGETKQAQRPIDFRRVEILNRLLELLSEQSPFTEGVLQSTIVSMFTNTYLTHMGGFFYTPDEIDNGCTDLPGCPLYVAIEIGVDDRLVVTIETFEAMLDEIPNLELARLLDAYTDYVQAMETAWQVMPLEKHNDLREAPRIRCAAGIAIFGESAYIADSVQNIILRVSMATDEIQFFCGTRGKAGLHDGPREMAKFNSPGGLAFCEGNFVLYVCDTGNHAIRAVSIPSGVVSTLSLSPMDPERYPSLDAPVSITIVRGDYEYEDEEGAEEAEHDDENASVISSNLGEGDDDDDDDGNRHLQQLEGISEEDDEIDTESYKAFAHSPGWDDDRTMMSRNAGRNFNAKYALATEPLAPKNRLLHPSGMSRRERRISTFSTDTWSRRTSGLSSHGVSRRTSGMSSLGSRRVSSSMTPGESVKDSLKECTEDDDEVGYNLAVTGDHCVYLVRPEKKEFLVLAGSPSEYGYKDSERGSDARFSSLKGIIGIRNCLFVADHWNNAIRCINLKTRQVDTVIDFSPCGPIALTVSSSGSVYVLDSEHVSVCNILKICSLPATAEESEGVLGTTMFKMIQDNIGRARSVLSSRDSFDASILDDMSRRGSLKVSSRRASMFSNESDLMSDVESRRTSMIEDSSSRRGSALGDTGPTQNLLGPRDVEQGRRHSDRPGGNFLEPGLSEPRRLSANVLGTPRQMSAAGSRRASSRSERSAKSESALGLPEVPRALRSLVPGASLHPALVQMTMRTQGAGARQQSVNTALTGSQFRVSVVSSVPEDDLDDAPEFVSFLNPKLGSPWKTIPIGTLQYVYQQATGQVTSNTPLALAYWDAADNEVTAAAGLRNPQQLLVGSAEWPSIVKVLPPRKGAPQEDGRFRAVAVDVDRVVMADSDSHQIFVVNHTKRAKHKIAGCGKAGYLDGPLDVCRMNNPSSIALDPTTHYIYVADSGNHRIRCIDLSTGFMSTVCGNGVKGNRDGNELRQQSLDSPFDIHFMHPCHLLISCADNSIRRLDLQMKQLDTLLVGS